MLNVDRFSVLEPPNFNLLQVGGKAMHELDYSSRSLMQLCKTRHPLCSIPRGYLIASALLP